MYTPVNPSVTIQKWGLRGSKLYVFVMWYFQSSPKGNEIASKARSFIGSDKWQLNKYHSSLAGVGDNKCNIFVADVLKEVDADAPNR